MSSFLAGVVASIVATGIVSAAIAVARAQRARLERGSSGVWVEGIYAAGDFTFSGEIERLDVVRQVEGLRGRVVVGTIVRIYSHDRGGMDHVRSYRVRGRAAEGQEVSHFWATAGDGSDGVLVLIHSNRDEMAGAYMRRNLQTGSLPLEHFPVRRVRVSSRRLSEFLRAGSFKPDRLREVSRWPTWVKHASSDIRQAVEGK